MNIIERFIFDGTRPWGISAYEFRPESVGWLRHKTRVAFRDSAHNCNAQEMTLVLRLVRHGEYKSILPELAR